jgi:HD-GYP domain-containing protein (c-di-GMP phosphodiesterase class II)
LNSRIDGLVTLLSRGIHHRQIYYPEHGKVTGCAGKLSKLLAAEIEASGEGSFFIGTTEGRIIHEGCMLLGASIVGRRIATFLAELGSGGLRFQRGVDEEQLIALFGVAVERERENQGNLAAARELFAARGIRRIELSPPYEHEGWFGHEEGGDGLEGDLETAGKGAMLPVYQSLFETVENAQGKAAGDHALNLDDARCVSEDFLGAAAGSPQDMMQLVHYPDPDSYTVGHSVRVAILCVLVGRSLGLPQHKLVELGTMGMLHDVGKVKVPDEILYKKGRLDADEIRQMRIHPEVGAEILLGSDKVEPAVVAGAWGHHLRHDLRGYPRVSAWSAQGETTALLQVCDVFEALTAVRPYKPATTPLRAYEIMFADEGAFHPGALRALVRAMGLHPPGSRVELSDGSRALVLRSGEKVDRPLLQLEAAADGAATAADETMTIDLADEHHANLAVREMLTSD